MNRLISFFRRRPKEEDLIDEYTRVVQRLEKRSELEEIGMITASIEHEIKNPLAVIESELEMMMARFQYDPHVIAGLKRIKEQKERIYAVTKMIRVFVKCCVWERQAATL